MCRNDGALLYGGILSFLWAKMVQRHVVTPMAAFCHSTDVKKYKMVELFNSVYIVDVKVHVFLDKGLWRKY